LEDTEEARTNLGKYPKALNIIEGPLMKVSHFLGSHHSHLIKCIDNCAFTCTEYTVSSRT